MNCLSCQSVVRTTSMEELGDLIDFPTGLWPIDEETDEISTKTAPVEQPPKPDYGKMRSASTVGVPRHDDKKVNNVHRRCNSTVAGSVEDKPKLVRSCGMRREWSFEDLRKTLTA
ncbi:hypothetical protein POM88_049814 [Heracleum sosnowskyi]|uniref:Uncharacterized protein n=1 Tax=Heracleum sosnowskyi TaxID=360622 RepID=A0AAD8GXS3_9APIA|nr:hypothetical protein POM88_049814 [Heracleum sosnowskyi]